MPAASTDTPAPIPAFVWAADATHGPSGATSSTPSDVIPSSPSPSPDSFPPNQNQWSSDYRPAILSIVRSAYVPVIPARVNWDYSVVMDAFLDHPTAAIAMLSDRLAPSAQLHTIIEWLSIYIAMFLWSVLSTIAYALPVGCIYLLGIAHTHTPLWGADCPATPPQQTISWIFWIYASMQRLICCLRLLRHVTHGLISILVHCITHSHIVRYRFVLSRLSGSLTSPARLSSPSRTVIPWWPFLSGCGLNVVPTHGTAPCGKPVMMSGVHL